MKKVLGIAVSALLVFSLVAFAACAKGKGSDPLVGSWAMVGAPEKKVNITKEGEQYMYEGSQGKTPATKKDENTLLVPMGPIEVTVKLDPKTGILNVSFMSESYNYKKVG